MWRVAALLVAALWGGSPTDATPCTIKVVGVGGGGSNAVTRMLRRPAKGVEYCCVNTDAQALSNIEKGAQRLQIGIDVTRGLGAGGNPAIGRLAAEESQQAIISSMEGSDLVFVVAGMGGGTGSGAAPVVASCAKQAGSLTIGVVTKPFLFEGVRRMRQAVQAIEELRDSTDSLIVISNDKLLASAPANLPLEQAFEVADDVLREGVAGLSDIIVRPGMVNVDFADVCAIMANGGLSFMGMGCADGKDRAIEAASMAARSPLLDFPVDSARSVLFCMRGPPDMSLAEVNRAAKVITETADPDANIIFGAVVDPDCGESVAITVVATGLSGVTPQ